MVKKQLTPEQEISKYIALILRHKPEVIGISLDEHGWVDVDQLIERISKTHPLNREMLEKIVRTDNKQRYSFNDDHSLIRANQGHSIPVDLELIPHTPPAILWHGTGERFASAIMREGLRPMERH